MILTLNFNESGMLISPNSSFLNLTFLGNCQLQKAVQSYKQQEIKIIALAKKIIAVSTPPNTKITQMIFNLNRSTKIITSESSFTNLHEMNLTNEEKQDVKNYLTAYKNVNKEKRRIILETCTIIGLVFFAIILGACRTIERSTTI